MAESSSPSGSRIPWIVAILFILLALPICVVMIFGFSGKEGTEFSPSDFSSRRFSYSRIEWLNLTLRGIRYQDTTSSLQQSLIDDGWIKPVIKTSKTWHLVSDSVTPGESPDFDAKILSDYLEMPFWEEWNLESANRKKAGSLWPAVATLARNYAYWAIPDLMDLAIDHQEYSDTEFITQIHSISSEALLHRGQALVGESSWEAAETAFSDGLRFKKTGPLYQGRAKVYDQLNKSDSAAADRKSASQLGEN